VPGREDCLNRLLGTEPVRTHPPGRRVSSNSYLQFPFLLSCPDRPLGKVAMPDGSFLDSRRSRFRAAMLLAMVADAVQIVLFPLFGEGALSPLDDVLDLIVAVALVRLIGWHWEFAPSLIAELVPGVDLIPFWTLAVANVYRKWKQAEKAGNQIDIAPLERKFLNH
jgi:hypothetical protein